MEGRMHAWNWSAIGKPKLEGCVGLKTVTKFNAAGTAKLFQRFCFSQKLQALWMRANYLKSAPVSSTTISILDSGTQKQIVQHMDIANG